MYPTWMARLGFAVARSICFRSPLLKGTYAITTHPLMDELVAAARLGELTCTLRSGVPVRVRLRDYNGRIIALFGLVEPAITRLIRRLAADDVECLLDIGSNYGGVGLNCIAPGVELHLFEPQPDLCNRLRESLADPRCRSARLHECALADHEGEFELVIDPNHTGAAFLAQGNSAPGAQRGEIRRVRVVDAERYLPSVLRGRPFAAKVDVEGGELAVVPALLRQPRMRFCIFESGIAANRAVLWEQVAAAGLRLYAIANGLWKPKLTEIHSAAGMAGQSDFLALAPDAALLARLPR